MTRIDESDKILDEAMKSLILTAAKDGIITKEEHKFIGEMEITFDYYRKALDKAFEDGIISKQESLHLHRIKEIIIAEGFEVAEEYKGVSQDMMNLLISIICSLKVPDATK